MLNNIAIANLKVKSKPYKKSDAGGLYLLVNPHGSKLWRFAYRFEGKQKLLSGGPYPKVSLLNARRWRDSMKALLELGRDPCEERKNEVLNQSAQTRALTTNTFESIARE